MPTPIAATIDRTTLVRGPGHLQFGSSLASRLYCESIRAELITERLPVAVAGFGTIDQRKKDEMIRVTVTPAGEFSSAIASLLWPYGSTAIGASIYGATDTAMGIQTMGGQKLTIHNAAITKLPSIYVAAGERLLVGNFEITGIIKNSTARTDAAALFTLAANAWSGQPTIANFVSLPSAATWALGSPETITPKQGWLIDFNLSLDWQKSPEVGTFDAWLKDLVVTAKCLPVGYAESKWANLLVQNTGAAIGAASRTQADLTIAQDNPGATIVLKNAWIRDLPLDFAANADRVKEVTWEARRDISAGYGALFSVTATT